jgi:two-component system CheB/CheR fusion protein
MAMRVSAMYGVLSAAWILSSDLALEWLGEWLGKDSSFVTKIAVAKGWLFVAVTSLLLFLFLRNRFRVILHNQEALRISEQRFEAIYNAVSDGVAIVDPASGRIVDVNDSFCRMLRGTRAELLNIDPVRLSQGDPPYSGAEVRAIIDLVVAGQPQVFEWRERDLTGRLFWVEMTARQARLGPENRLVITVRDIEQRKQSERRQLELERARTEAAESANVAKDEFLAMVSHELRTPLTPVLLALGGLERHPQIPDDCHEELVLMRRHVEMESRLIDDLLDLTRVMSRKLSLRRGDCDVHAAIQSAAQICQPILAEKTLRLDLALAAPPAQAHVRGDVGRIEQVFWNLLGNAAKFTPPGGTITVRTCIQEAVAPPAVLAHTADPVPDAGPTLVTEITDTGIGMTADQLSRAFLMFEQADRSTTRKYGGLGIGLAICKAIIELHGGTITAASAGPGQGVTMTVRLPCVTA